MDQPKPAFFSLFFRNIIAPLLVIALATLLVLPVRRFLGAQLIGMLFLLPVMLNVALWGLGPGVLTAFTAFLVFNYFFIPPYHTLAVHQTQDLITLIVFLIVAVVMSQLIGQAKEGIRLAKSREWEATRMYALISALSGLQDNASIARSLAEQILETFLGESVEVWINGRIDEPALSYREPKNSASDQEPSQRVPMVTARAVEGEIRLWTQHSPLSEGEVRLLETFATQGALAIERIRLMKAENKAHVLEESDRMKSSLLSSVSHELRSPLAVIKASISGLRSGVVGWETDAREELLATIEEETDHLNSLVGNLLDMSRIEAGALNPQLRWNSLAEIAMGAAAKLKKRVQTFQLKLEFAEDFPLVPTDYVLIEQVFTNLISNGAKYGPPDSLILVSAYKEGGMAHVEVKNHGPNVPEEHLERIFDKFYRVTAAERVTGTGLGLSICKGIVEAHGGRIWAKNAPDGFIFHFTLPLTLNGAFPQFPKEAEVIDAKKEISATPPEHDASLDGR
jgi:two-component system sensor histidine kinase KdpD